MHAMSQVVLPLLFVVTVTGFLVAAGYYIFCTFFGSRLLARCEVPGEAQFDIDPAMNPLRITARARPGQGPHADVRVELEREGSWLWSRDVRLQLGVDAVPVDRLQVDRPGRYRIKTFSASNLRPGPRDLAAVDVRIRVHEPRAAVYLVSMSMLAGGFVTLLLLMAR